MNAQLLAQLKDDLTPEQLQKVIEAFAEDKAAQKQAAYENPADEFSATQKDVEGNPLKLTGTGVRPIQRMSTCNRCGSGNVAWVKSRTSVYPEVYKPNHPKAGQPHPKGAADRLPGPGLQRGQAHRGPGLAAPLGLLRPHGRGHARGRTQGRRAGQHRRHRRGRPLRAQALRRLQQHRGQRGGRRHRDRVPGPARQRRGGEVMKLVAALSKAFRKEGQSLSEFTAEYKQLTDKDKADFKVWFEAEGVSIED